MTDRVRVLVIGPAPSGPHSRGGMATVVESMAAHPDSRFEITVVPTYLDVTGWQRLSVGMRGMLRASMHIARGRTDIVHVHLSHGGSVARKALPLMAARATGTPAIVHGHSFDFGGWFDTLSTFAQRAVRAALPADRWLVLGSQHADEYAARLGLAPDRIQVLHNAVPIPADSATQSGIERVHAVMLGRIGRRKGSYDLVAAVAGLEPAIRRRLRVTLAGDGEIDEIHAAITAAGLDDTISVAGWVDGIQRDELLRSAQLFLLPSYDEGLPMALLEAMAAGLAPITTAAGSIGEVVTQGHNGLLVDAGRPDQIADALRALVTDEPRRARIGAAARATVGGFSVKRWYDQLATLWASLAGLPAAHPVPAALGRVG